MAGTLFWIDAIQVFIGAEDHPATQGSRHEIGLVNRRAEMFPATGMARRARRPTLPTLFRSPGHLDGAGLYRAGDVLQQFGVSVKAGVALAEFIHDARLGGVDQVFEVGHVITHAREDGDIILSAGVKRADLSCLQRLGSNRSLGRWITVRNLPFLRLRVGWERDWECIDPDAQIA
jgi:hypothetical protein